MQKIFDTAETLGKMITETEEYKASKAAEEKFNDDMALQSAIAEFNLKKQALAFESKKQDAEEASLNALQEEVRELYNTVMSNETMQAYMQAQETFGKVANQVFGILNFHITGRKPEGEEGGGCGGGGCGSGCSGCS